MHCLNGTYRMFEICSQLSAEDVLAEANLGTSIRVQLQVGHQLEVIKLGIFVCLIKGTGFLSSPLLSCSVEQFLDLQMRQLTWERHVSQRKSFVNILRACHEKHLGEYSVEALKMHRNTPLYFTSLFRGSKDVSYPNSVFLIQGSNECMETRNFH